MLASLIYTERFATPAAWMKQEDKGTVAISLVAYSVALATRRGVAAEPLLAQAGIAPALLGSRAHGCPRNNTARCGTRSRARSTTSFRAGSPPDAQRQLHRDEPGGAVRTRRPARDGARGEFHALRARRPARGADANPQRVRLRFVHRNNGATPAMFTYATYFIIVYGLTCWLIGRRIPLLHASFRCDTPPADHEYPSMFCDDMRFNGRFVCRFRSRIRDAAGRAEREDAEDVPAQRAGELHRQVPQPERARAACARCCAGCRPPRGQAPAGWPRGCTWPRRRCAASCGGPRVPVDQDTLRRDLAFEALADPGRTIADVAAATGFAEPSAFYRAFRKWSGRSPADYRDEVLARGGGAS